MTEDALTVALGYKDVLKYEGYEKLEERLKKAIFEKGDAVSLDIYTKLYAVRYNKQYISYERLFGLCKLLGISNLYDIGCGDAYQAFMLTDYTLSGHWNVFYTGIDCHGDFTYINEIFKEYGEKIKFLNAFYPFEITPAPNNIAISCYAIGMERDEEKIKNIETALSRDFERILINVHPSFTHRWEKNIEGFEIHKIRNTKYIFGTKFPEEISKLKDMGYDYFNDEFALSVASSFRICEDVSASGIYCTK